MIDMSKSALVVVTNTKNPLFTFNCLLKQCYCSLRFWEYLVKLYTNMQKEKKQFHLLMEDQPQWFIDELYSYVPKFSVNRIDRSCEYIVLFQSF